jgi:hypothetical protein
MTTLAIVIAVAAVAVLIVLVVGIALCSHFDAEYFGDDSDCHP